MIIAVRKVLASLTQPIWLSTIRVKRLMEITIAGGMTSLRPPKSPMVSSRTGRIQINLMI
jgi:hypothetical protein